MKPLHQNPSLPLLDLPNKTHNHDHIQVARTLLSSSKPYDDHYQENVCKNGSNFECNTHSSNNGLQPGGHHAIMNVIKEEAPSSSSEQNILLQHDDCGRERLKRHRVEVAGRVWIPDIWGQEELLKDWIDCSAFDASLMPNRIMSARAALVEEGRRATSGRLRIENRC